ncbi:MAG: Xaa-Pro dipeptidase [Gammaproteobacteria bacterium]|nr:Xaa-Pro dipeptidase [Gammaproteobacteria bacterium]
MIPNDSYTQHLELVCTQLDQALAETGFDSLLIYSGHAPLRYRDDLHFPFRCNPQFRWLVPDAYARSWLLYTPGTRPQLLLYQPDDYWHSVPALPETFWSEQLDIRPYSAESELKGLLAGAAQRAFLGNRSDCGTDLELGQENPAALNARLDWQRSFKTRYEQDCLREANRIAVRGHRAVARAVQSPCSENSLHLSYMKACGQGENRLPYDSIIALNEHAAVLHWTALSAKTQQPKQILSLLIDAGADCFGYAADITRTYAGEVGLFSDLLESMDNMQQEIVSSITVGRSYVDLHRTAQRGIAKILQDFGVLRVNVDQALDEGVLNTFFPHGLGHLLGLQVHDVAGHQSDRGGATRPPPEDCPALRNTRNIEEDQTFTIEPGLYFIESLLRALYDSDNRKSVNWATVEKLIPCGGVRIEDNIVVLADGVENLTRNAFATATTSAQDQGDYK